ncbi:hypothetical protein, variant [Aphanomyces astaci]|nr:hypothetical protein, variant [Aphanomyces astaci]ETV83593.1 hypothetical protein, variant [Aphanomyces astaci]|eukprot:XP_009827023.1 hypothetical protein, variant [Aphanomyces astaci]
MVAEREAATATTLEYLLAQVDLKLLHFKQELLNHVHKELQQTPLPFRNGHPTSFKESTMGNDVDESNIRSASLVSNPSELEELAQEHPRLPPKEGECVHPIDAVIEEAATPRINAAAYILQFTRVHAPEKGLHDCHSGESFPYETLVDVVACLAHNLRTLHGFHAVDIVWLPMDSNSPLRTFLVMLAVWTLGGSIVWSSVHPPLVTWVCVDSTFDRTSLTRSSLSTHIPDGTLHVLHVDAPLEQSHSDVLYTDLLVTPATTPSTVHPLKAPHWVLPSKVAMTLHLSNANNQDEPSVEFSYSHGDLLAAMETSIGVFRSRFQRAQSSFMSTLPLAAPESLTFVLLPSIFYGTPLHFLTPSHVADLPKALRLAKPAVLVATGLHLSELVKANDAMTCLEEVVCIGMSVPSLPRTLRALHTLSSKWRPDLKFRRLYASPATAGVCIESPPMAFPIPPTQLRALGRAVSNDVQVCVRSLSTGATLGPKQVGELCVCRLDLHHLTQQFPTNAMAYVDVDGQVHGIGSKDGIVNLGCESTTTLELEEVLASHPLVEDAVVSAAAMTAYIKLAPAAATYVDDALRSVSIFAAKQIPPAKQLSQIMRVLDIPRQLDGQPSCPIGLYETNPAY